MNCAAAPLQYSISLSITLKSDLPMSAACTRNHCAGQSMSIFSRMIIYITGLLLQQLS